MEEELAEEYERATSCQGQRDCILDFECTLYDGLGEHNEW